MPASGRRLQLVRSLPTSASQGENERKVASRKEQFDLLYHTLERYNDRYVAAVISVAGALLVIIENDGAENDGPETTTAQAASQLTVRP